MLLNNARQPRVIFFLSCNQQLLNDLLFWELSTNSVSSWREILVLMRESIAFSAYKKLFDLSLPGERVIVICASGSLSVISGCFDSHQPRYSKSRQNKICITLPTMYDIAGYIGNKSREIQELDRPWLEKDKISFSCNFLLGGQVAGEEPQLYLIYPQGNFIPSKPEKTPFLQIGETKYGKPIIDRTYYLRNTPRRCG